MAARAVAAVGPAPAFEVLRDPDHRRSLLVRQLDDLEREAAPAGTWQLHRRSELGEQAGLPSFLEPLHDGLEDDERHPRQPFELLVPMDPALEVDLPAYSPLSGWIIPDSSG